jgi:hypothetical protein
MYRRSTAFRVGFTWKAEKAVGDGPCHLAHVPLLDVQAHQLADGDQEQQACVLGETLRYPFLNYADTLVREKPSQVALAMGLMIFMAHSRYHFPNL